MPIDYENQPPKALTPTKKTLELFYKGYVKDPITHEARQDIEGLVAFALYKIEQAEWEELNTPSPEEIINYDKNLVPTRILGLRASAEKHLLAFTERVRDELQDELKLAIMQELEDEIDNRTTLEIVRQISESLRVVIAENDHKNFWKNIVTNIAIWILTLIIPIIFWISFFTPNIKEIMLKLP